jgi:hypothetical protein
MANILALSVCKIRDNDKIEYNKNQSTQATFEIYNAMSEIVIHSAETFIQEDFDIVVFEDEVDSYQEIFHKNFQNVYDLWQDEGPNNIFYLDCDTLITKPLEIFGKPERFCMFNYTDPKTLSGADANNKYGIQHEHYFNAGVRYYPDTMPAELWDLGWSYAKDWDYNIWGTEQIIFNEMMFAQDRDYQTWLNPAMNYQAMGLTPQTLDDGARLNALNNWNGCEINDAKVMHLHGTRGAGNTLLTQWAIWKRLTGEEFEFTNLAVEQDQTATSLRLVPKT